MHFSSAMRENSIFKRSTECSEIPCWDFQALFRIGFVAESSKRTI